MKWTKDSRGYSVPDLALVINVVGSADDAALFNVIFGVGSDTCVLDVNMTERDAWKLAESRLIEYIEEYFTGSYVQYTKAIGSPHIFPDAINHFMMVGVCRGYDRAEGAVVVDFPGHPNMHFRHLDELGIPQELSVISPSKYSEFYTIVDSVADFDGVIKEAVIYQMFHTTANSDWFSRKNLTSRDELAIAGKMMHCRQAGIIKYNGDKASVFAKPWINPEALGDINESPFAFGTIFKYPIK